ncbi:acyl-CoA dehydrogenase family protein [Alicyclobacillus dauci]|uniref:Acyl-CoA dehydrogenase family protein n=1 Tax=Alicyclobacillus dauci TaxID=1475485 RepID=A0ABY6Z018_9BACL|nr:acyl-CoA dehydrogenase family protein [Alicyclobacillus dauci]WAH36214.1 acyl-CoA dehydrogenase family protein [Alicyclobacillus dauci]
MGTFTFTTAQIPKEAEKLRLEIRQLLKEEQEHFLPSCDAWLGGFSPEFSKKLGQMGYIGMTWPKKYGGHERSQFERYVVIEELLAAGAPVAAHWIADRQMAPLILRHGNEEQKMRFVPEIAKGNSYWAIGMSEPNAGSDLAAVQSKLEPDGDGFRLSGQKLWSSGAHACHYMMALVRSSSAGKTRHEGLSNVVVDFTDECVEIRPIYLMNGEHHFNEVIFHDVFIPKENVIGEIGDGWRQVTEELAFERSGPERFLSTFPLLTTLVEATKSNPQLFSSEIAPLIAELTALRELSLSIAGVLGNGGNPAVEAALVKDAGTTFERKVTEVAERIFETVPEQGNAERFSHLLAQALMHGPGFTIRGGTNEILRGIVARGLGLR